MGTVLESAVCLVYAWPDNQLYYIQRNVVFIKIDQKFRKIKVEKYHISHINVVLIQLKIISNFLCTHIIFRKINY
jgi:hypothetical protein